jgi:UDP-N-acetylmuramoylalanine--D-glutamate ligase
LKISGDKLEVLQGGRSMKSIFEKIKMVAEEGDVVLLSPSATSYDMYKNYQDRGEEFIKYAQNY